MYVCMYVYKYSNQKKKKIEKHQGFMKYPQDLGIRRHTAPTL